MAVDAPGTLIGAGRSADVYDIGGGRVLRRYRDGRDAQAVERGARVMVHAGASGVPVPEVFDVSGSDIVMARATGPTMLGALVRQPWTVHAQARLLAQLHDLVHQVPYLPGLPAPLAYDDRDDRGTHVLLHLDLHPENVILTANGPVIIDWEGAARGPGMYDVAMTWVIIAFSRIPGSRIRAAALRGVQRLFTWSFVRVADPIDQFMRTAAIRRRLADPHLLPAEAARMERLVRG
jgi:aminoglycoside phosphotransferase (APT) family kinase protein